MPPLPGFSDNPFKTHSDFKTACISLLRQLKPYQSPGGARIRLPLATGTHFDDIAAQVEGFARPLWAIGALIHGGTLTSEEHSELVVPYVRGLANGTNPKHEEYWGPVENRDQRMVEIEIISFALLVAPDAMYHPQTPQAKLNIRDWIGAIIYKGLDFPVTNWLWFRVITNLALVKVCGLHYLNVKHNMDRDLDQIEAFYLGNGWAADGIWDENGRQADYYSGSFAIQFSQLLYCKMAEDLDPVRCTKFRQRALAFAESFSRYFDSNGAAIPFGRSLTYRFAFAAFWAAAAFAGVQLPAPLDDWGLVKGLLLRHFRWWSDKHDIFNIDGTLTIGFTFPNMYMSEDYNSPQSPYWAMKSFIALGLPPEHPFWTAKEKPLPKTSSLATVVKPTMQIICDTGNHHFLLSAGQFCPWPLKATEAKYCKYAYSSHFGFSVPTGSSVPAQMAPDNTLAVSRDGGDTWRIPWKVSNYRFGTTSLVKKATNVITEIPTLQSTWKPWRDSGIEILTTIIAPSRKCGPDWHVRVHEVRQGSGTAPAILVTEGGFAIQGRGAKRGEVLREFDPHPDIEATDRGFTIKGRGIPPGLVVQNFEETFEWVLFVNNIAGHIEGTIQSPNGALICSNAGASGIRPINTSPALVENVQSEVLKPDANTNLMWQRTLIPTIKYGVKSLRVGDTASMVTGVFAISRRPGQEALYDEIELEERWNDFPHVIQEGTSAEHVEADEYISFRYS